MKRKKPTNKELQNVISNLIMDLQFVHNKVDAIGNAFGLYLDYKKHQELFDEFIKEKVKDAQEKMSKENVNEPGETK